MFGLGNKQYEHFCAVGKRVHKALGALGGKALVRRGDGDDDEDIEADFESWRTELYTGLDKSDVLVKSTVSNKPPALPSGDVSLTCMPSQHSVADGDIWHGGPRTACAVHTSK